jgi:hypothetical protein
MKKVKMMIDYRDVLIRWTEGDSQPFETLVGVGDGTIEFDDSFDFDERVFYYFEDQSEFDSFKSGKFGNDFEIVEVV